MPNTHALLAPSSAARWLNCTAAPLYEAQFPDTTSEYAEEGTKAHTMCELYARRQFCGMTTREFNRKVKALEPTAEMLAGAMRYVEHLRERAMTYSTQPHIALEVSVPLGDYIPDGHGTCDCIMVGGDTLTVTDFKFGKGVAVVAENNPQLMLYALGALALYRPLYGDTLCNVVMVIDQPRLDAYSEARMTTAELLAWGENTVKPAAEVATNGTGTYCPGEWCRFCRGKAQCAARAADYSDALRAFEQVHDRSTPHPEEGLMGCATDEEMANWLTRLKPAVEWLKDLETHLLSRALAGAGLPGWKAVEGRSNRTFADQDRAFDILRANSYPDATLYDRVPKSLAALEMFLGKPHFATLLGAEVVKPPGKPTLVPATDRRPAITGAELAFAKVEAPGDG